MTYSVDMRFEWDPEKAAANEEKHVRIISARMATSSEIRMYHEYMEATQ